VERGFRPARDLVIELLHFAILDQRHVTFLPRPLHLCCAAQFMLRSRKDNGGAANSAMQRPWVMERLEDLREYLLPST
jgi:hypothetical protein